MNRRGALACLLGLRLALMPKPRRARRFAGMGLNQFGKSQVSHELLQRKRARFMREADRIQQMRLDHASAFLRSYGPLLPFGSP